ncbi:DsbA family oxidoreductase [Bradyrhizobium jicamae]|uniref:DsbA family oxidoreductase n=1 Tax=Bradyrhizobium jicamae TaxID=280332 RepID=A0ABS5FU06_9BRAD|nr:DsbA family oxidoreductase [Bradyrhizobium jicamae]MBR0800330.1 DsbA family oxidoreductase [Bradyrhizobium jicamae]
MTCTVTITSDFICPWCLIGERRLEQAISKLPNDVVVEQKWHPFELNPDMPSEGVNRQAYRSLEFGSWERSQRLDAHTIVAAKDDNIRFNYGAIDRTPNTLLAHRLMRFAAVQGLATPLAKAIFSAYFEHGRDIGDASVLADIAAEIELERAGAIAFLASESETNEVRDAERAAQQWGTRSVPLFDIDGELVSGAQSVEAFEAALSRAVDRVGCSDGACTVS